VKGKGSRVHPHLSHHRLEEEEVVTRSDSWTEWTDL